MDILVVDDEADIRSLVSDILKDEGYESRSAKNSVTAFEAISEKIPDAIILDIWLKDSALDGLGILEAVKKKYSNVPVIMMSGHGNIQSAVSALKLGAYDYVEKPFKQDRLLHALEKSIENSSLKCENTLLRYQVSTPKITLGNSNAIIHLRQDIEKVAPTGSRVFISAQKGLFKEEIAKIIHDKSHRKSDQFISLSCATISSDAINEEIFGSEELSDINAPCRTVGAIEKANGGTLFIDAIDKLPSDTQGKLLKFLQDKKFTRVGGVNQIESDVRVISCSDGNINDSMESGDFRSDLFFRLNVVEVNLPTLRERRDDIPLLCDYFIAHSAQSFKMQPITISQEAMAVLQAYSWPGNIMQLHNVMEWLLIMHPNIGAENTVISSEMLPKEIFSNPTTSSADNSYNNVDIMSLQLRKAREIFEKQYLEAQINRFGGNISRTASFVGMERSALHRKLKSLSIGEDESA